MKRLAWIFVAACNTEPQPVVPADPQPTLQRDAAPVDAAPSTFIGVVSAGQTANIAPRVAGLLSRVLVGPGDQVALDQVVAEMDPVQMKEDLHAAQALLAAATSAVAKAMVDVEDAKRKLIIETKAVEQGVSPSQNLEEARLNVKRAQATAQQLRSSQAVESARVKNVEANVTDTRLRAPFAGTIAQRYRDAGNRVEAGQPIVKIAGHGSMRLLFAVPSAMASAVPLHARVTATIATVARPVFATVKQVPPGVDPASGLILIEAELEGDTRDIRAGLDAIVAPTTTLKP
ncbi:MAG: efflux RND transporter periplasmic adaptor subunit [Kofleriaceae bacterium]